MFTGIIQGIGEVVDNAWPLSVLRIVCPLFKENKYQKLGASVAVNGICLTVSHVDRASSHILGFTLGKETQSISLLPRLKKGALVNIEFSLVLGDSLDGHLVQGHVDGLAEIAAITDIENGRLMRLKIAPSLVPLIMPKGSVAINGVALTVNTVENDAFDVCLVPYTMSHTTLRENQEGELVHLETDVIGRYLFNFFKLSASIPSPIASQRL